MSEKTQEVYGLSIKEQSCIMWAVCRYNNNPEACPLNLMKDLNGECPFEYNCEGVPMWGWLDILEKRKRPEDAGK